MPTQLKKRQKVINRKKCTVKYKTWCKFIFENKKIFLFLSIINYLITDYSNKLPVTNYAQ
jgi:hypothetical protein